MLGFVCVWVCVWLHLGSMISPYCNGGRAFEPFIPDILSVRFWLKAAAHSQGTPSILCGFFLSVFTYKYARIPIIMPNAGDPCECVKIVL